ncbi:MAG: alcohol dehydrogenase catalytic domain-containing protein [bacterium]|nr:alcohol dehydrogenase catalytic domain-containing protein [bacterium]
MKTMLAARFSNARQPLDLVETPIPDLGPGEVLVAVEACGLCGTDLHIVHEGSIRPERVPITLGHEAAGVVDRVGREVAGWKAGDRVAVYPHEPCGICPSCTGGSEALCPSTRVLGLHLDGGFAQYLKIRADCLLSLPEEIPFDQGAILTDAVSTAYHALTRRAHLAAGETLAVFGCGGVGHHAVKLAKLLGAGRILAVDLEQGALRRAGEAGADEIIDATGASPARAIRELTGGEGVDLALECVGRASTVVEAMKSLRRGGRLIVVGVGTDRVQLPPLRVFVGAELTVMGSMGFSRKDMEEVLRLTAEGRLDVSQSVTQRWPLEKINEALEGLERRVGDPVRMVVTPAASTSDPS